MSRTLREKAMLIPAFLISQGISNAKGGIRLDLFTEGRGGQCGWRGGSERRQGPDHKGSVGHAKAFDFLSK